MKYGGNQLRKWMKLTLFPVDNVVAAKLIEREETAILSEAEKQWLLCLVD